MYNMAVIQMTSGANITQNLAEAGRFIDIAVQQGAHCVVLPENFAFLGHPKEKIPHRELFNSGTLQNFLSDIAKKNKIWIIAGTMPIMDTENQDKVYAACLVFNDCGVIVARYNKIHLFDVLIRNEEEHHESQKITPGHEIIVVPTPFGKLGLTVCYDIRFPELFRALQEKGAEIIALPSAFTVPTGKAHWEVLIRARAIENQVYMLASAQCGTHNQQRKTFGHSMIVDPWGKIIAALENDPGVTTAQIDLTYLQQLRHDFPVLKHRKY